MSKTILIVEDEQAILKALVAKLEHEGFTTIAATHGQEALDSIEPQEPDLILLDILMPVMNGFDFLEALRDHKCNAPVIISSNLNQDADIERAKELGAVDYYVKSDVSIDEVLDIVKRHLQS